MVSPINMLEFFFRFFSYRHIRYFYIYYPKRIESPLVLLNSHWAAPTGLKMSFQDLEAGLQPSRGSPFGGPQSPQDAAFLQLQSSLSLQVFKINSNVQGMLKLVDQVRLLVLPLLFLTKNPHHLFLYF